MIPNRLGGPGGLENLVVQSREMNLSHLSAVEKRLLEWAQNNKEVYVVINVHYNDAKRTAVVTDLTYDVTITGYDGAVSIRRFTIP